SCGCRRSLRHLVARWSPTRLWEGYGNLPGRCGRQQYQKTNYPFGPGMGHTFFARWHSPSFYSRFTEPVDLDLGSSVGWLRFARCTAELACPSFRVLWRMEFGWSLLFLRQQLFW